MSSRNDPPGWSEAPVHAPWAAAAPQPRQPPAPKQVVFQVDYGMIGHGLAPLYIDGQPTELSSWGLSSDIVRRLKRLNELYDRQLDPPGEPTWRPSERDRNEFNALLPFVVSELQVALGERWQIVVESRPL